MAQLHLEVVTPERSVVKGAAVESIILPATQGQMTVLPGHISLVTSLKPGSFAYQAGGVWQWAVLSGGFAQIVGERVIVLAETVELARELDVARAELALKKAQEAIKKTEAGTSAYEEAWLAKERAEARIRFTRDTSVRN